MNRTEKKESEPEVDAARVAAVVERVENFWADGRPAWLKELEHVERSLLLYIRDLQKRVNELEEKVTK